MQRNYSCKYIFLKKSIRQQNIKGDVMLGRLSAIINNLWNVMKHNFWKMSYNQKWNVLCPIENYEELKAAFVDQLDDFFGLLVQTSLRLL